MVSDEMHKKAHYDKYDDLLCNSLNAEYGVLMDLANHDVKGQCLVSSLKLSYVASLLRRAQIEITKLKEELGK